MVPTFQLLLAKKEENIKDRKAIKEKTHSIYNIIYPNLGNKKPNKKGPLIVICESFAYKNAKILPATTSQVRKKP